MINTIIPQTIKNQILLVVTAIMLTLVFIPSYFFYQSFMTNVLSTQKQTGENTYKQVLTALNIKNKTIAMLAVAVSQMEGVREAMYLEDRDMLLEATLPLWKTLHKDYNINVFHFHKAPAISFLRLHKLEKFGDDLSAFRHTVVECNKEKKLITALEQGRFGLANRAVIPVFYGEEHTGSVEFGMAVNDHALMEIQQQMKSDVFLVKRDGNSFKYLAKTGNRAPLSPTRFQIFDRVMKTKEIVSQAEVMDGNKYITTYGPVRDFSGEIAAVLVVPVNISAAIITAQKTLLKIIAIGVFILLLSFIGLALFFQRRVNRPITSLNNVLKLTSGGDFTQKVKLENDLTEQRATKNEFVVLSLYVNNLIGSIQKMVGEINVTSSELNESATVLTTVSSELSLGTEQAANRSQNVADATTEMSRNLQTVSVATEQASENVQLMNSRTEGINTTIGNIQKSTSQAKNITEQAVTQSVDVSKKMSDLGSAASDIGKVTETITEISAQTNLLALNATIEAARAGEAGKGFAVVANEIKDLARQTSAATGEISSRIEGIQSSTGAAVTGIEEISKIIRKIDSIVSDIADSLNEQGDTLSELTENIQQVGNGISEVADNVTQSSTVSNDIAIDVVQVNSATVELAKGSSNVQSSANELKKLSESLQTMILKFKID